MGFSPRTAHYELRKTLIMVIGNSFGVGSIQLIVSPARKTRAGGIPLLQSGPQHVDNVLPCFDFSAI